jgi:hypothetical protein
MEVEVTDMEEVCLWAVTGISVLEVTTSAAELLAEGNPIMKVT